MRRVTAVAIAVMAAAPWLADCSNDSNGPGTLTVTSVSPGSGPLAGGTSVTVTGNNFIAVTSVTIAGREVGIRAVVSPTEITGTTPGGVSAGVTDVVVTSSSRGSGTCSGCFSYLPVVPATTVTLADGGSHTCGLAATGAAYCWGLNDYGQLGNGSTRNSSTPVAVAGGLTFLTLAAGYDHTCGITSDGAAYCWGRNGEGQLGNGSFTSSSVPVAVTGGLSFSAITTGGGQTCGLTSAGRAFCWGANDFGELGNGGFTSSSIPVPVAGDLRFGAVAKGFGFYTCALTSAGAGYCWGDNSTTDPIPIPVPVSGGLSFTTLATGSFHSCGLTSGGAAYCWGDNHWGELGANTCDICAAVTPVPVYGSLSFRTIASGGGYTCGVTSTAAGYCWGNNEKGQLGDGSTANDSAPAAVSGGLRFRVIAPGYDHTCGFTSDGALYCWGDNSYGQFGNGSTASSRVPVMVAGQPAPRPSVALVTVTPGTAALMVGDTVRLVATVRDSGANSLTDRVVTWTSSNPLVATVSVTGLVSAVGADPPAAAITATSEGVSGSAVVTVTAPASVDTLHFATVEPGAHHTCGVTPAGAAYCWGHGLLGELGNEKTADAATPQAVAGGLTFAAVSVGGPNTCGVTAGGAAYCWGSDGYGQLGAGAPAPDLCGSDQSPCSIRPLAVAGGHGFASLSAGWGSACGLDAGGVAYCWGDNSFGQLGIGGDTAGLATCFFANPCSHTPMAVTSGLMFTAIGTGTSSVCGLTSTGAAYCWGDNRFGQLGIGTASGADVCGGDPCSRTPVPVVGGLTFTQLSVGYYHSCGLVTNGAWYCWGSNNYGQLGNGTIGPDTCYDECSATPVAVSGPPDPTCHTAAPCVIFATVFPGGRRYSCGVTSGGVAYCWGENILGQLGDGSTVNSLAAVAVAGGLTFASLSAYLYHTCGLTTGGVAYCWGRNSYGQLGTGATGPEMCLDIFWCSTVPARVGGQAATALRAPVRVVGRDRSPAPSARRPEGP